MKIITEKTLAAKERAAKHACEIPTVFVPVAKVIPEKPQNCKGGNIEACQNYAWCAQCVNPSRSETGPFEKIIIGQTEVLDTRKYLK